MLRWCLAVVYGSALLWGQPRPPQNWTVSGTVTDSLTARPIADAVVLWEPSFASYGFRDRPIESEGPSAGAARAVTDASGTFTVSVDPTATGVRLYISHAGYRSQDGKARAAVAVRAGSPPLAIRMTPQSTIQGRITNTAGEPLQGIGVSLTRVEIRDGRRQAWQTYSQVADAGGAFLFEDLPPDAYYLRAAGAAYGPVYYPDAFSQDQARLLRAAPGKAIVADFHLASHASFRIRGVVTNMPLRRTVAIRLLRGDDALSNPASVGPNGTFEVSGVAPGSYTLQAYIPDITPLSLGEVEVAVEDRDSTAVKVTLSEGVDVAGHVEFRGSGGAQKFAVLYAMPFHPRRWPEDFKEPVVTMQPNGDFVFKNLPPGKYDIAARGLPDVYLADIHAELKSVSTDVMEKGLTVPAEDPPTLAIVMQSGAGEITGRIDGANPGELFSVALIVMRGDVAIPTIVRAPDGRFHIAGLTPGDYTLLAWPDSRAVEYRNPAVLSDLLPGGTPVSLAAGAKRTVLVPPVP